MGVFEELFKDPGRVSAVLLLLIAVAAFVKGWIVSGMMYTSALAAKDAQIAKLEKDVDEYKALTFKAVNIAERTQNIRGKAFDQP